MISGHCLSDPSLMIVLLFGPKTLYCKSAWNFITYMGNNTNMWFFILGATKEKINPTSNNQPSTELRLQSSRMGHILFQCFGPDKSWTMYAPVLQRLQLGCGSASRTSTSWKRSAFASKVSVRTSMDAYSYTCIYIYYIISYIYYIIYIYIYYIIYIYIILYIYII